MKPPRITLTRTALTVGALTALAAALLAPGVAAADPDADAGPLLDTTCSFAQIDAAVHDVAPEFAGRLDADPDRKARLQAFFDRTPDERRAIVDRFLQNHPNIADDPRSDEFAAKAREVADTCHNY